MGMSRGKTYLKIIVSAIEVIMTASFPLLSKVMKALRPAGACVVQLAVCCTEYTVQCTLHVQNSTTLEISLVNYLRR